MQRANTYVQHAGRAAHRLAAPVVARNAARQARPDGSSSGQGSVSMKGQQPRPRNTTPTTGLKRGRAGSMYREQGQATARAWVPSYRSSVQHTVWTQQNKVSAQLKQIADDLVAAASKLEDGPEAWQRWSTSSTSSAAAALSKADAIVKRCSADVLRSSVIFGQRIRIALLSGKRNLAMSLYNTMKKSNVAPSAITLSTMFTGLGNIARREDAKVVTSDTFVEQVASLKRDLCDLHLTASKLWVPPRARRGLVDAAQIAAAEKEQDEMLQLADTSSASLAAAPPSMRMRASRAKAALELRDDAAPLSRVYAAYLLLLARTTARDQPRVIWEAYEALRNGLDQPDDVARGRITTFEFARPYRSTVIFTTMLWTVFFQVSSRERLPGAQEAQDSPVDKDKTRSEDGSLEPSDQSTNADTSTPYKQARQLWLDWESVILEAERRGSLKRKEWDELAVDAKALELFAGFFERCRSPEEQAFAKHVHSSPITHHLSKQA